MENEALILKQDKREHMNYVIIMAIMIAALMAWNLIINRLFASLAFA